MKILKNLKKGAIFGIDARITMAVTAIAAFVIGVNKFADFDREDKKQVAIEQRLIKNAIMQYYEDNYTVPASVDELINNQYIELDNGSLDPWAQDYEIGFVSEEKVIQNSVMDVKYVYILSNGKNLVKDTADITTVAEWRSLEPAEDDILIKFDTVETEKEVAEIENLQLEIVKNLLEGYITAKQEENSLYCEDEDYQLLPVCDVNEDGIYIEKEELDLNYTPQEISDTNGNYYMTTNGTYGTENKFKSGYINTTTNYQYNMYTFMDLIGGASEYVVSPRGLVLHFDSNKYNNTQSPYATDIWYDDEVTVF